MVRSRFQYSRWDGTQVPIELDADDVLSEITDDLLYHGKLQTACRRLVQSGFAGEMGERMKGLREMMEQLRRKRREELEAHNLSGVLGEIRDRLDDIEAKEHREIDHRLTDPKTSDADRTRAENAGMEMSMLPSDLGEELKALQEHDWQSEEARADFEALMEELKQELLDKYLSQMSSALGNMSPEDMQRLKDMMAELNQMLADRAAGKEPDFQGFMSRYGDFFPENPRNLDQLANLLRSANTPAALAEVDVDKARELLGDDAARSLERLSELAKLLQEAGYIDTREGRMELTPKGMKKIGQNALGDIFKHLQKDRTGKHEILRTGGAGERTFESKAY